MKKSLNILLFFIVGLVVSSCASHVKENNDQGLSMWVNSQLIDCVGVGPMKCMQVQESDSIIDGEWKMFYSKIEGFDFQEGFVYHLKITKEELYPKTVAADASTIKYSLIKVISKEKVEVSMNGKWSLETIIMKALSISDENKIPTIEVDIQAKKMSGFNACNRFSMTVELAPDNKMILGPAAVTRMMCPEPNYEKDFMEALNQVSSYLLNEHKLLLYDENGKQLLSFER